MSTTATATETPYAFDLIGRPALHGGTLTTITATRGNGVCTADNPELVRPAGEVATLPMTGELVELNDATGYWIGFLKTTPDFSKPVEFLILTGEAVKVLACDVTHIDARQIVKNGLSPAASAPMVALLSEVRDHHATRQQHAEWVATLVANAHEKATFEGWCDQFDDFLEAHGLPRRTRDYDLRVEVTATVYLSAEGTSADDAVESLTIDEVWDALSKDNIDWEAEED